MTEKILVRAPNWIGDQILSYPFFYYLRKIFPRASVSVACVEWVESLQFKDLVQEVIVLPKRIYGKDSLFDKFQNLEESASILKKRGPWDYAFALPHSLSSSWLLYRSGAKKRIRSEGHSTRELIHRAQSYVNLLEQVPTHTQSTYKNINQFWGALPEGPLDSRVKGELELFDAMSSWPDANPIIPPTQDYWVLAPGSQASSRRWPLEFYSELVRLIHRKTDLTGIIVGGPKEAPMAQELCDRHGGILLDFTALGPPSCLWKIFRQSRFTVSNDSGLAHIAALAGAFVQIVWGAGDPLRTRPLGPGRVQVAVNPVDCWPCEKNSCQQSASLNLQCLLGLKPETIWKEIERGIQLERDTL